MRLKRNLIKIGSLGVMASIATVSLTSCGSALNFDSSVQLIVSDNSSTLADQSFSESSYDGIRDFFKSTINVDLPVASDKSIKENNGIWKRPGADTISRIASYRYAFEDGAKILVATGYNQQEGLQQISSDAPDYAQFKNSFKENAFVFVDGAMVKGNGGDAGDYKKYDSDPYNISSVSYRADDGSFLAGVSTAVFLNMNQNYFDKTPNGNLGVSSFVGLALGSTLNYFNGFRLGIHYWNAILQPNIKNVSSNLPTLPVEWVSPTKGNNDITQFTSGSFSSTEPKANTLTKGMIANGASSIFPIAGPQTSLVVNQIVSDGSKSIVVGVDTAQENTKSLENTLPKGGSSVGSGKVIQFSSIKNLSGSTTSILKAITSGQNGANAQEVEGYKGLGWNNVGTVTNAGVGVSDAGLKYLINPDASNYVGKDLTLDSILKDGNLVAKALEANDPVIKKYNELLSGTYKTDTVANVNGMNGPVKNKPGDWKIYNNVEVVNEKGEKSWANNFISQDLSNLVPGITDRLNDKNSNWVTYPVPEPTANYIAKTQDPTLYVSKDVYSADSIKFRWT